MKILLLIILMSHAFSGQFDVSVLEKVVSSPEAASIILWNQTSNVSFPEPQSYTAKLYEINITEMTIVEVKIPEIKFQSN